MKVEKTVRIKYQCEYCLHEYCQAEKAMECESSHTPIGIGSAVQYHHREEYRDHGHPCLEYILVSGTIIDHDQDGRFLIELTDLSREWRHKWWLYRELAKG